MSTSRSTPRSRYIRYFVSAAALAASGVLGGAYLTIRYRSARLRQEPLASAETQTSVAAPPMVIAAIPLEQSTVSELYALAQAHGIPGRSGMRKAQLIEALEQHGVTSA